MVQGHLRRAFLWSAILFLALTAAIAIGVVLDWVAGRLIPCRLCHGPPAGNLIGR